MFLFLKIVLVPGLVAGVTIAARRWGPRIGGWLTALPVVAGPTLCFYAIEQGHGFAAQAAQTTLVGLVAVAAHCVAYAWSCRRATWPVSITFGWIAFAVVTLVLYQLELNLIVSLVLALASFAIAERALPSRQPISGGAGNAARDLLMRMLAAAALVLMLTSLADRLGPSLTGFLTSFPVATAIIAAFTHAERGADAVVSYFHGFLSALNSFALFCFVFALGLARLGLPSAIVAALSLQLVIQAIHLWRMTRSR
jgi:hypothetical protein